MTVKFLLAATGHDAVDLHAMDEQGFRSACARGHVIVVRELLALRGHRAVNVHAEEEYAFRAACASGHVEVLRELLALSGNRQVDMQAKRNAGLRSACVYGQGGVVEVLLSQPQPRAIDLAAFAKQEVAHSAWFTEDVSFMSRLFDACGVPVVPAGGGTGALLRHMVLAAVRRPQVSEAPRGGRRAAQRALRSRNAHQQGGSRTAHDPGSGARGGRYDAHLEAAALHPACCRALSSRGDDYHMKRALLRGCFSWLLRCASQPGFGELVLAIRQPTSGQHGHLSAAMAASLRSIVWRGVQEAVQQPDGTVQLVGRMGRRTLLLRRAQVAAKRSAAQRQGVQSTAPQAPPEGPAAVSTPREWRDRGSRRSGWARRGGGRRRGRSEAARQ